MIPSINLSIMYVVYPEIQREFSGTSPGALSWILNGYTIVAAATLVLGGVLADRTGRKRALLVGSALSLVSVIVCGSAPNVEHVAGRSHHSGPRRIVDHPLDDFARTAGVPAEQERDGVRRAGIVRRRIGGGRARRSVRSSSTSAAGGGPSSSTFRSLW